MSADQILKQVNEIFKEILEDDTISLTMETTIEDVDAWDSLNHIQLVVAVERHFSIRCTSKEIQSWKNVGELVDSIMQKTV
jgi:acyl carrier protein